MFCNHFLCVNCSNRVHSLQENKNHSETSLSGTKVAFLGGVSEFPASLLLVSAPFSIVAEACRCEVIHLRMRSGGTELL